jgi:hypothetical protein
MDSLSQELKNNSSLSIDNFCLNPNPGSCSGLISNETNFETINFPVLSEDHKLKISENFKESRKIICEKCIWVRKSN